MKRQSVATITLVIVVLLSTLTNVQPAIAQGVCVDSYEPNDDKPRQLEPGLIQATICSKGDVDMYTFNVSAGDYVYLSLTNLPADYDLSLYSNNKKDWVGTSENGNTTNEEIKWTATKSDVLYIVITGYDGATSTKSYSLNFKRIPKMINFDSKTSDPSAQLTQEVRNNLKIHLKSGGFERLMELTSLMTDYVPCLEGIAFGFANQFQFPPDTSVSCAGAITQINEVINKYYK